MASFTEEEVKAIKALRGRVKPWAEETQNKYALDYLDDATLWRFALAHKFKLDAAEHMFKTSTTYKQEWDLDKLCGDFAGEGNSDGLSSEERNQVRIGKQVFYAGIVDAKTSKGGPISAEKLGKIDFAGLSHNEEAKKACLKAYAVHTENLWRLVRETGDKTKAISIVDLDGIGMSAARYVNLIRDVTALSIPNYPEVVEKVVIIRAPTVFYIMWKVIKPFLPERTKAKVSILGRNFEEELSELVEGGIQALPTFLGGNADDSSVSPARKVEEVMTSAELDV
uniref:CRAL-TRIO domain-containing protein n=1 Tax=Aplanochytrium stocchinoi TaxID=215587 RepID=A0A7S3UYH9_9STRA|mmetsp:Transcript_13863/g.17192  ORF Transcript_13863/g.17192 Transcript_13863/m.17192 type:complete len:282 (+) Transcript_13863:78-923(+)|eukprot:CAMPEP_0204835986 /NCGR_PEP_ID=MMETSP1346-20131115/24184_1 /ASSEMBLY_ACC=CAM_ASM_000771 /TAXON_ID=215587 /ORGANISM="Aplanochytrium stocchinoi, Strain GSBS06" /LENGTH=281 /DNA_ID=CAMNT_0051970441 /DNA_START=66 /DNA_END=911 /DNA_ORIENTATION=+